MIKLNELFPSESKLLMDPYQLTGRKLIILSIIELLFLRRLQKQKVRFEETDVEILNLNNDRNLSNLRNYHLLILDLVKEHYSFYPEPVEKDALLTPDRLVRMVYGKMDYSYFRFKRKFVLGSLRKNKLCRYPFPFYYLKMIRTKTGKALYERLKGILQEIDVNFFHYKKEKQERLNEIISELGPNILFAYNHVEILKIKKKTHTGMPLPSESVLDALVIDDGFGFEFPDLDWPSFEFPDFDISDSVGSILSIFDD